MSSFSILIMLLWFLSTFFIKKIHCKWNKEGEKQHKEINFSVYRDVSDSLSFFSFPALGIVIILLLPVVIMMFLSLSLSLGNLGDARGTGIKLQPSGSSRLASRAGRHQGGPERRCVWILWPFQQLQGKRGAACSRQAPRGPCPSLAGSEAPLWALI